MDKKLLVYFALDQQLEAETDDILKGLLHMNAGVGQNEGAIETLRSPTTNSHQDGTTTYEAAAESDFFPVHDEDDESIVHVDEDLLRRLEHEDGMQLDRISKLKKTKTKLICHGER